MKVEYSVDFDNFEDLNKRIDLMLEKAKNNKQVYDFFDILIQRFDITISYQNITLWQKAVDLAIKYNALDFFSEMASLAQRVFMDLDYDWINFTYYFGNNSLYFKIKVASEEQFEQDLKYFMQFKNAIKSAVFLKRM